MSGERQQGNSSLGTMLAFGVGALVGAGVAWASSHYASESQREQNHRQNPRAQESNGPKPRIREPCFCGNDDDPIDCYINVCGNSFHRNCLQKWVEMQRESNRAVTCPNCRIVFNESRHVTAV